MDNLKRNQKYILDNIKETDGQFVTTKKMRIEVPKDFEDVDLVVTGERTYVVGSFAIIMEDSTYAVFSVNAMCELAEYTMSVKKYGDREYYVFSFDAGKPFIKSSTALRDGNVTYNLFKYYVLRAKVPWYINYVDVAMAFDTATSNSGLNIDERPEVLEVMVSLATRDPKDDTMPFRLSKAKRARFVPLGNINYGAGTTFHRIVGNYQEQGLISSLVRTSTSSSGVEEVVRK